MKLILMMLTATIASCACAQTRLIIVGDVKDAKTNEPLAYATVAIKNSTEQTISDPDGKFKLSISAEASRDTLMITYVGYEKFEKPAWQLASIEHVLLNDLVTVLDEVRIVFRQLDLRNFDRALKPIRGNLYACEAEVTNEYYNNFLAWLEDYNKMDERKKYDFNVDGYKKSVQDFYKRYHKPSTIQKKSKKDSIERFDSYPAVNITYEGAVEYCKWLTDQYNENPKRKKFKKVVFRLPTLKEWQIAALGYSKFQSWDLSENTVECVVPTDTLNISKGEKKMLNANDVMYPWYKFYYLRNRAYNHKGCFLGNFKVDSEEPITCPAHPRAFDGYTMMAPVRRYFPNDFYLSDVVGNVAEMIDEKGKACGGSWNDTPENSTIRSVKAYNGADETVGFRLFMEVIEK